MPNRIGPVPASSFRSFLATWQDIGDLLQSATPEEQMQLLLHYIEVVELGAIDPQTRTGNYAMRLFPEVRPDRGFDFDGGNAPNGSTPSPVTTNGAVPPSGNDSESVNPGPFGSHNRPENSPSLSQLDLYFVERGTLVLKKLQRSRVIVLHPWNELVDESDLRTPTPKERPNGMKLARHYQALLDTGRFESRAALARYLGVSRARVTQVLKRIHSFAPDTRPVTRKEPKAS